MNQFFCLFLQPAFFSHKLEVKKSFRIIEQFPPNRQVCITESDWDKNVDQFWAEKLPMTSKRSEIFFEERLIIKRFHFNISRGQSKTNQKLFCSKILFQSSKMLQPNIFCQLIYLWTEQITFEFTVYSLLTYLKPSFLFREYFLIFVMLAVKFHLR